MFQELFGKQPLIVSLQMDNEIEQKIAKLIQAGLNCFELLSYSSHLMSHLRSMYPHIKIGIGNILKIEDLERAYEHQADFMSTPGFMPSLLKTANVYQMPLIPGVSSISDAMQTMEYGFVHCRPCPGDLDLCNLLNQYIPQMKLYPINIDWDMIDQFLDLPSVAAVGISNPDHLQILQISESLRV
jgi:2-dehydro-3-deoxyphosphogluconate aldolase/(4S)-4-hydroxy-2-oxoglutarate aldolase